MPSFWDEVNIFFKSKGVLCVFICVAWVESTDYFT